MMAALLGWGMWGSVRGWCFAQIPDSAGWAKILVVAAIEYMGGIALPLFFLAADY